MPPQIKSVSMKPKATRKHTPESSFFNDLKGQAVEVDLLVDGVTVEGLLVWVDRYSVGIRKPDKDSKVELFYKHALQSIRPAGDE